MNHRDEVHGQLLEPCAQAAALLEPAHALLDGAAPPVELRVEAMAPIVRLLVAASRNHNSDRMAVKPGAGAGSYNPCRPPRSPDASAAVRAVGGCGRGSGLLRTACSRGPARR